MNPAALIKVLMIVGFFVNGDAVAREAEITTKEKCEAAQSYAVEFNARGSYFWQDERMIAVACLPHPRDREA